MKWILLISAVLNYGYMLFDGLRALIIGDYIRPTSGEHAGELGPWSKLVSAVGIDPESMLMKVLFILIGSIGILCAIALLKDVSWSLRAFLVISIISLFYLVPGTVLSVLQIILIVILMYGLRVKS